MTVIFALGAACVAIYCLNQIYTVFRFRIKYMQGKADLLADPLYIATVILVYFLCYGMVISGTVEYLFSPEFVSGGNLPFVVYGLPLMALAPTIMLDDGAYAYSPTSLYWKNREWDLSAVQIVSVKKNEALGRALIRVSIILRRCDGYETKYTGYVTGLAGHRVCYGRHYGNITVFLENCQLNGRGIENEGERAGKEKDEVYGVYFVRSFFDRCRNIWRL